MPLNIDPVIPFEPSRTTKGLWKYVRHSSYQIGGITLPGLFQVSYFAVDMLAFLSAIALEIWGLANLLIVGQIEVIYVIVLFLLDILFAICAHLPHGAVNLRENRKIFVQDSTDLYRLKAQIRFMRWLSRFFGLLIFSVAALKIVLFLALQGGVFDALTAGITVSYAVVATIHVVSTGYFLMAVFAQLFLAVDRFRFRRAEDSSLTIRGDRPFAFDSILKLSPFQVDHHELLKLPKEPGKPYRYELRTRGMLMDGQVTAFCLPQPSEEAQMNLARESIKAQVRIMEQQPVRPVKWRKVSEGKEGGGERKDKKEPLPQPETHLGLRAVKDPPKEEAG